ncbi:sodium:calcium antiporter [Phenylobacterium sp.]|uniref:sodium:calcium antiporter n=1 Tax=Phenylobacterium sp. TaxID=1871053 RepID=UPI0035B1ACD6
MIWIVLEFALLAAIIAVAGFWLSRFGDIIAERTGLSGSWVGLVMLATVTSLPELVTGVTASAVLRAPDLAIGDALGSCVFNLLLFVAVDFFYRPDRMYARASQGHVLSAGYGSILLAVVGLNILAGPRLAALTHAPVGAATIVIVLVYLLAVRTIFSYERRQLMEPAEVAVERYPQATVRRAILGYAIAGACVFSAGMMLPDAALRLADAMGWSRTFVGTMFLAMATSLPELVVTLAAVRSGALDMGVASLLGSNLFNMMVLALDDLVYAPGPIMADASPTHAATALSAVAMNAVIIVGLIYRPAGRPFGAVSWASIGLIGIYIATAWMAFAGVGSAAG